MPGAPRSIVIGGGIQPGTPFTLNQLLRITNVTPPTASDSVARQGTDGAVGYLTVGTAYTASPGASEQFRLKSGMISEGLGTDTLVIGRGASAGNAGNLRGIAIGTGASTGNGNDSVVVGYNTSSNGQSSAVVIGSTASLSSASGDVIGYGAIGSGNAGGAVVMAIGQLSNAQASSAGGQDSMAIGWFSAARAYDTVVGHGATSNVQSVFGNKNTVIGRQAHANKAQGQSTAIGADATANVLNGIAIGQAAVAGADTVIAIGQAGGTTAAGTKSITIGTAAVSQHDQNILIGHGAVSIGTGHLVLGGTNLEVVTVLIGKGDAVASPSARVIRFTNASGADNAAGSLTIIPPRSTGNNAAESTLVIQRAVLGASSSTVQTLNDALSFTPGGIVWNASVAPSGAAATYVTGSRSRMVAFGNAASSDAFSFRQVITAGAAGFIGYRGDGTIAAPTALVTGDTILNVGGAGYDGTSWGVVTQALMRVVAAENWSNTARGTKLEFRTTKNTTTGETTVVTFEDYGAVTINPITAGTAAINLGANALTNAGGAGAGTLNNLPAAVVAGNPAVYVVMNVNGTPTYFPGWQ